MLTYCCSWTIVRLDTLDGEVATWDFDDVQYYSFDSAGEFYAWLKKKCEELEIFPVSGMNPAPDEVMHLKSDRHQGYIDLVRSLGWPPKNGGGWNREEGMKEVGRVGHEYRCL